MKLAFAVLAFVKLAFAIPRLESRLGSGAVLGTAYFQTNDPQGNAIVASNINGDASLTYVRSTSTGGLGVHGTGTSGPDATFSQGIVQVHQGKHLLATVNTASSTVVLFSINKNDPTRLTMLGSPVPSGGDFPNSVAFNKAGNLLCVLNTGTVNGVACFSVTSTGLRLARDTVRSLGLNQTNPATGPYNTGSQVAFTKDESSLVVAVKGTPTAPGFLAAWSFSSGKTHLSAAYTYIPTPPGGGLPFSLTPIAGAADAFLSADFAVGFDVFDFSNGGPGGVASSARTSTTTIEGQEAACWTAYSPALDAYYVIDTVALVTTTVKLDGDLAPVLVGNFTAPSSPVDASVVNVYGKDYLYALLSGSLQVAIWRLDSAASVTPLPFFDASVAEKDVHLTSGVPQGMAVYVKSWD